jgi:magnesium transporter
MDEIAALADPLHAADLADLFERLGPSEHLVFINALGERLDPEFVSHVDESVREELVNHS